MLEVIAQVTSQLAARLNARMLTVHGKSFNLPEAMNEVQDFRAKIAASDTDN